MPQRHPSVPCYTKLALLWLFNNNSVCFFRSMYAPMLGVCGVWHGFVQASREDGELGDGEEEDEMQGDVVYNDVHGHERACINILLICTPSRWWWMSCTRFGSLGHHLVRLGLPES
ncbi:hypothetical protein GOP47_0023897 [Adiantum capillus-veneris]|uniref:Uncharacterized protein n=1 Tax=Adiantum capillus-veneris TaxID=13818 RepID=A0A9D4U5H2_ADICA|nr:hypothetical protein GOP47_0023897 [Adiantum capillus-veneris]